MSVVVDNLTKLYNKQKALDKVSFEAPKGKITGFLGPNGAGKSTTMKIATGYLMPTSGLVKVAGHDPVQNPLKVKRLTGYLPEHNPLYLEMYVKEYLLFISSAYRLSNSKERVEEIVQLCGLDREQQKRISALSKGYRQRVGLAQALIHDPEVLILDEPTSGLDPNQLVEIRKVIKEVSAEKTVILSTHIMQEVEALCDQVVIIDKGSIVANSKIEDLKKGQKDKIIYRVEFEEEIDVKLFESVDLEISAVGDHSYLIAGSSDPRKEIMKIASEHSLPLININKEEQSLEHIFQELTGSE